MAFIILETTFDVTSKFPECVKCLAKLSFNITFKAVLSIFTFLVALGGRPFSFTKANLSTVQVWDVKSPLSVISGEILTFRRQILKNIQTNIDKNSDSFLGGSGKSGGKCEKGEVFFLETFVFIYLVLGCTWLAFAMLCYISKVENIRTTIILPKIGHAWRHVYSADKSQCFKISVIYLFLNKTCWNIKKPLMMCYIVVCSWGN